MDAFRKNLWERKGNRIGWEEKLGKTMVLENLSFWLIPQGILVCRYNTRVVLPRGKETEPVATPPQSAIGHLG